VHEYEISLSSRVELEKCRVYVGDYLRALRFGLAKLSLMIM
jgi:hypothetical protein